MEKRMLFVYIVSNYRITNKKITMQQVLINYISYSLCWPILWKLIKKSSFYLKYMGSHVMYFQEEEFTNGMLNSDKRSWNNLLILTLSSYINPAVIQLILCTSLRGNHSYPPLIFSYNYFLLIIQYNKPNNWLAVGVALVDKCTRGSFNYIGIL